MIAGIAGLLIGIEKYRQFADWNICVGVMFFLFSILPGLAQSWWLADGGDNDREQICKQ